MYCALVNEIHEEWQTNKKLMSCLGQSSARDCSPAAEWVLGGHGVDRSELRTRSLVGFYLSWSWSYSHKVGQADNTNNR